MHVFRGPLLLFVMAFAAELDVTPLDRESCKDGSGLSMQSAGREWLEASLDGLQLLQRTVQGYSASATLDHKRQAQANHAAKASFMTPGCVVLMSVVFLAASAIPVIIALILEHRRPNANIGSTAGARDLLESMYRRKTGPVASKQELLASPALMSASSYRGMTPPMEARAIPFVGSARQESSYPVLRPAYAFPNVTNPTLITSHASPPLPAMGTERSLPSTHGVAQSIPQISSSAVQYETIQRTSAGSIPGTWNYHNQLVLNARHGSPPGQLESVPSSPVSPGSPMKQVTIVTTPIHQSEPVAGVPQQLTASALSNHNHINSDYVGIWVYDDMPHASTDPSKHSYEISLDANGMEFRQRLPAGELISGKLAASNDAVLGDLRKEDGQFFGALRLNFDVHRGAMISQLKPAGDNEFGEAVEAFREK